MFNKVILIGRLGQNAEAKTAQNNCENAVLNIATQESWKNDKGDYETRTEWHRVYAWRNLSKFAALSRRDSALEDRGHCGSFRQRRRRVNRRLLGGWEDYPIHRYPHKRFTHPRLTRMLSFERM
jgi:hypothetical protein